VVSCWCGPPLLDANSAQVVERQAKRAKLSEEESNVYHVEELAPLAADDLAAQVAALFASEEMKQDEHALTQMLQQVRRMRDDSSLLLSMQASSADLSGSH